MYVNPNEKGKKGSKAYRIAIVLAIVLFIVIAPEVQNGNSMDPSINSGDVCVGYKFARYSEKRKIPERDTLVILDKTISLDAGADDNIITRVIAVPGDTVEIVDGDVLVNDEIYTTKNDVSGAKGKYAKVELEGNEVFVLSDNRASAKFQTYDSRNPKLGLVDMRKIRARVLFRVWPIKKLGSMSNK